MSGDRQLKTAHSNSPRAPLGPEAFKFVKPLLDGRAEPYSLASSIREGEVKPEDVRRPVFMNFSKLLITDVGEKKALIEAIMERTECKMQKEELSLIRDMESGAPDTYAMFPLAFRLGTDVLFEYALEKLRAFQECPLGTAHEKEFIDDVLQTIREIAKRDPRLFRDARETLLEIRDNGASPGVKSLVCDELREMEFYEPTAYTHRGTLAMPAREQ